MPHCPPPTASTPDAPLAGLGSCLQALLGFLLLLSGAWAGAATPPASWINQDSDYVMRRWLVEDGLPHNTVSRVLQDRQGYLWLGTGAGLVRFTGSRFTEYPLPRTPELPKRLGENIRDLCIDQDQNILFIPASGGVISSRGGVMAPHAMTAETKDLQLLELHSEPGGVLWVGSYSGPDRLLLRWEKGRCTRLVQNTGPLGSNARFSFARDSLGRTWLACGNFLGWYHEGTLVHCTLLQGTDFAVAPARSGGVWVATGESLVRIDGTQLTILREGAACRDFTSGVRSLHEDRSHTLWIGTRRLGLFYLREGGSVHALRINDVVTTIMEDQESDLWVTTEGSGIYRIKPRMFSLLDASSGMVENNSLSICDAPDGTVWCANRGGGLVHSVSGKLIPVPRADGGPVYATSVNVDSRGTVWVGATEGLLCVRPGDSAPQLELVNPGLRDIRVLFRDRRDQLWIATADNRLLVMRGTECLDKTGDMGFEQRRVSCITEDLDGTVWVATLDQVITGFNELQVTQRHRRDQFPGGGNIQTSVTDSLGNTWFGTTQGLVLKGRKGFVSLTETQGLADNMIYQLLEDSRGRLWVGSRRGLSVIPLRDLYAVTEGRAPRISPTRFGMDEGLPPTSVSDGTQPNCWRAHDGRLWFTTHAGTMAIQPDALLRSRPAPQLYIDRILLDHRPAARTEPLVIPAGTRLLEVRVDTLLLAASEQIRLRHRLEGYDPDWNDTMAGGDIAYVRVPPGDYVLHLHASNADGRQAARELRLPLRVEPSWWQRGWFVGICILAGSYLVAGSVRFWSQRRLRRQLEQLRQAHLLEVERARIARDLHDQLGGSVTQLVLLADRQQRHAADEELRHSLSQLTLRARRLAGEVESIVWAVNPGNNTWAQLASFIDHYARRFCRDAGLDFRCEGAETIPTLALNPEVQHHILAIVKEALNNIVKHARARRATMILAQEGQCLLLRLSDDGIGFDPDAPEHGERNGLTHIRHRITELGAQGAMRSTPGKGSELSLQVPMKHPGGKIQAHTPCPPP